MERRRSPTSQLSRDLGALRLSRGEPHETRSQGATLPNHSEDSEPIHHVSVPFHSGAERGHPSIHKHCDSEPCACDCEQDDVLLQQMKSLTVSSDTSRTSDNQLEQFHDHFNSNSLDCRHREELVVPSNAVASGNHGPWAWSRGGHSNGSCRDEALGVGYVDDITVEDLAGYFDQMLHLPKPMSDMAQLMYT